MLCVWCIVKQAVWLVWYIVNQATLGLINSCLGEQVSNWHLLNCQISHLASGNCHLGTVTCHLACPVDVESCIMDIPASLMKPFLWYPHHWLDRKHKRATWPRTCLVDVWRRTLWQKNWVMQLFRTLESWTCLLVTFALLTLGQVICSLTWEGGFVS